MTRGSHGVAPFGRPRVPVPQGCCKAETSPPPVYPESHLSFLANVYNHRIDP
ncbi:hypothetical protein [Pseudomonas sp. ES3-33]|uniref:hypothetical protein n=1 Tax=Pseudomonas sp. ES3-33 TaxID=1628833 RepID=UPI001364C40B|nr:hypothetical protein [Pseudomonas sp. ES3-33]